MRCHYEVLCVSRDADEAEIKKNYRKLALQYHPDKNPDTLAECTRIFHEVQSAYEVLGDKQERAWYDKHRERILRGGDDFVDDSLDVWHYFQPGVFKGYNDDEKGFYTVFRDVFQKISAEDEPYLDDDDEEYDVPEFGDSTSDYETVVKSFYSYWLGYCTKKSYVWKEKYDLKQAPNRPTQRLMEKENKKFRDTYRKKRNEEIRGLVAYVRKRDKRVQAYRKQLESKNAENQLKLEKRREDDIRRNNQLLENYEEQEWMAFDHNKLDDIDSHFDEQFGETFNSESDSEDEKVDHFYCIACDKNFKSEKALANHEKSKKHKENVELIKSELLDDEALLKDLRIDDDTLQTPLSDSIETSDVVSTETVEESKEADGEANSQKNTDVIGVTAPPIHHTDSLIYTKMKTSNLSRGSIKMKEKKKKGKMSSDAVFDDDENDWLARHEHVKLGQQDSLALPRKKSKKQELRESTDRVRIDVNDIPINERDASLGKSTITNSIRLVKRPTKADRKKARRKLQGIQENENETSNNESNEDGYINFTANGKSDDDEESASTDEEDEDEDENLSGKRSPTLQGSVIADSIRYNKDHMEHTGKHLLVKQKYEAALKKEEEENDGDDDAFLDVDDDLEQASLPSPRSVHRSFICDSIRYNKEHIEPKGKHILTQKNEEKRNSPEPTEVLQKRNSKKDKSSKEQTFSCEVCTKQYPTRNKLFDHIKLEGHAIVKESPPNRKKGKKGKNKK